MAADGSVIIDTRMDTSGVQNGVSAIRQSFGGLGSVVKKIGILIGGAFAIGKLTQFGKECVELGSNLSEVQNVVDVTFTTMSDKVNEFAKNAMTSAGLSETMAKQYVGTFGAMSKSFGFSEAQAYDMSTALTQLTGDVASFYNISQDLAYIKLKSVFTGETETLKDLGVVMTQSALDQYALANGYGKTTSEMTEQEKVALRLAFVQKQLSAASGDFIRTSDSWANQVRVMQLQIQSLKATVGQGLINIFTPVIKVINILLAKLATVANAFKSFTELITGNKSSGQTGASGAGLTGTDLSATEDAYGSAADGADSLADATQNVTDSTKDSTGALKKQNKALKKNIASFDELNVIGKDSSDTSDSTKTPAISDIGIGDIGNVDYGKLADVSDEADKATSAVGKLAKKLKELGDIFKGGFFEGLGDYKPMLNELISDLGNIKKYLTDIFTDPDVKKAASEFAKKVVKNLGKIAGSIAKVGLTLATALVGGIESYLSKNVDRIKKFIIRMFDVAGEIADEIGDLSVVFADIFSVFGGQTTQNIIGSVIQVISDTIMTAMTLSGQMLRDSINLLLVPLQENAELIKQTIENTLQPIETVITAIADAWQIAMDELIAMYDAHIKPFFDSLANGLSEILTVFLNAYNSYIVPVLDQLAAKISEIMAGPVGDVIHNAIELIGKIVDALKVLWENVLVPLVKFIIGNVAPQIASALSIVGNVFLELFASVAEVVAGILKALGGVIDFIVGVFTGDWKRAWEGVKNIFKGVFEALVGIAKVPINGVIALINGMIRGIISGVNTAIGVLNHLKIKVPNWVPKIGGSTWGFTIPTMTAPQIPYLAKGTVVPRNAGEFAAILGDNKRETEVVSPLSTMKQAMMEALKESGNGGSGSPQYIVLNIDGNEFIRWLRDQNGQYRNRTGFGIFEG
uniref:Minor tail protein n=1 Tax=Siphoviridae sp. ct0Bp21 TaxID=2825291 RepID=A0A8S5V2Z1_9CAUD|nr:MAG TPA: minor tail protein [Siphoviridae sp. ct0Bp21]